MIIATGGEFLHTHWYDDEVGRSFVALDRNGHERIRITWTRWPHWTTRPQRLRLVGDLCAVELDPALQHVEGARHLDDPRYTLRALEPPPP